MSTNTTSSTALSEAESRVITVKTETGDIVKYSGNPAELPGAPHETRKALRRSGAFSLLIKNNASRLRSGVIAVEDLSSIPIVTQLVIDPESDSYSYDRPCQPTSQRIERMNEIRTELGQKPYVAVTGLSDIPDKLLKLAVPNPDEVGIEAHAYALTQLSIFEDRHHANELLEKCEYVPRCLRGS